MIIQRNVPMSIEGYVWTGFLAIPDIIYTEQNVYAGNPTRYEVCMICEVYMKKLERADDVWPNGSLFGEMHNAFRSRLNKDQYNMIIHI